MLETLLEHPFFLNRHREAPLLKEREVFLHHLQRQGTSRAALQDLSNELLNVVRLLKLSEMRGVALDEIQRAAQRWARQQRSNPKAHSYGNSASFFIYAAKKWLRFHGCLKMPSAPQMRFAGQLDNFARYMTEEQGLSPQSVRSHCWKTSKFLAWVGQRHRSLMRVSIEEVDEFLAMKGAAGWNRKSVSVAAQALRAFFRYAETRSQCAAGFARGIQAPRIYQHEELPEGPTEKQVRQLLQSAKGSSHAALRTRAILMLLAAYGLRSGEVSRLLLSDFDWRQAVFVVNHSKKGGSQRFPLHREVGDAILHYLQEARPRCACRHLFVTLCPPYRPVGPSVLWWVTNSRLTATGLRFRHTGPHSLRHACATRLLQKGASFKEIGDVLGHRGPESVGIYAKVDLNALRAVAKVNLGGLL
jgi:integrase/recombinase XerD